MEAVVEFQGFKDNYNRFIVKEFALVSSGVKIHFVFGPPYEKSRLSSKLQRTALWLSLHYHRIEWEYGDFEYDEDYIRLLCKPFSILYTKGLEKAKFLREFHSNVQEIGNTEVDDVTSYCILPQHNNDVTARCALSKALQGYKWLRNIDLDSL